MCLHSPGKRDARLWKWRKWPACSDVSFGIEERKPSGKVLKVTMLEVEPSSGRCARGGRVLVVVDIISVMERS